MKNAVPGFPEMDVPGYNEIRPNPTEAQPSRGPLAHVPIGIQAVQDYGAPSEPAAFAYDYQAPTCAPTSSASVRHPDAESPIKKRAR